MFIYLNKWDQLIKLYKFIPDNYKCFYEVVRNKCKFFLILSANCSNIEIKKWNEDISFIKNELILFFKRVLNRNIEILEYCCFPTISEPILSCNLIINNYYFSSKDYKNLINMFLNTINIEYKNLIDNIYGETKILLVENSRKINSSRKKIYLGYKDNKQIVIKKEGLVTNLEDTELLHVEFHMNNICKNIKDIKIYNQKKNIIEKEDGYLYIIKEREFIRMNEHIYKIGCTNNIIRRYKQYPKESKIIYSIIHDEYKKMEKKWIIRLNNNKNLVNRKDIGKEYYEGYYKIIINELTIINI